MPSTTNVHEARARTIKAYRLALVLARACADGGFDPLRLPFATDAERARTAVIADVNPPSEATWAMACDLAAAMLEHDHHRKEGTL